MKSKTEAKRTQILEAAADVFREKGFEGASMSEIRARLGGSKATLYNYFPSKEKLFFEVMYRAPELELESIMGDLDADAADFGEELVRFGARFLAVIYSETGVAIRRLAIAESARSEIGKVCFERATLPIEERVGEFLRQAMKHGRLRTAKVSVATAHLLSLLESEFRERVFLGVMGPLRPAQIQAAARRAVAVFLAGYDPRSARD